jgi:hypothetical protein
MTVGYERITALGFHRINALVSRDLANFLVGYTEVTRWGMPNGASFAVASTVVKM